jgi:hypothetical protein
MRREHPGFVYKGYGEVSAALPARWPPSYEWIDVPHASPPQHKEVDKGRRVRHFSMCAWSGCRARFVPVFCEACLVNNQRKSGT